jgi:hypothetical protein
MWLGRIFTSTIMAAMAGGLTGMVVAKRWNKALKASLIN